LVEETCLNTSPTIVNVEKKLVGLCTFLAEFRATVDIALVLLLVLSNSLANLLGL